MKYGTVSLWMIVLLGLPQTALAAWGENWGEMVWGLPVSVPSVPAVGLFVLAFGLLTTAAWRLRARKALHSALAILVVPMLAGVLSFPAHAQVTVPNTFADGTPALASEVNANFNALESAVNGIPCATAADVVCNATCPDCGSSDFYDQGVAEGVASVDITTDNAAAYASGAASVDITTDNETLCTGAGGTYEAGSAQPCENTHMGWRNGGQGYIANYWHSGGGTTCQILGSNVSGCVIPPGGPSGTTEATCAQWCEDYVPAGMESDYQRFSYSPSEGVCQCGWIDNPNGNNPNPQFWTCPKAESCSVDITTDNAAAAAAAGSAACAEAGGTWEAGTSTCTAAYNCFVAGFCAEVAIDYPPGLYGYTNVYDGHTPWVEPALGAGCSSVLGLEAWDDGGYARFGIPLFPTIGNLCASN